MADLAGGGPIIPGEWSPDSLSRLGVSGLLAAGLFALLRGWLVPRYLYDRETARADYWQGKAVDLLTQALATRAVAADATDSAERLAAQMAREFERELQRRGTGGTGGMPRLPDPPA